MVMKENSSNSGVQYVPYFIKGLQSPDYFLVLEVEIVVKIKTWVSKIKIKELDLKSQQWHCG